jgi:plasmid maintenance system antidote protein VapI
MQTDAPRPAQAFPVGHYLRDELEARGWTVIDLVTRMAPIQAVEERAVTSLAVNLLLHVDDPRARMGKLAEPIAKALGVSVEFMTNLERAYVEWSAASEGEKANG